MTNLLARVLTLAIALGLAGRGLAQPNALSLHRFRADIPTTSSGPVRAELGPAILDACGPTFDDVRLATGGSPISFVIESASASRELRYETPPVTPLEAMQEQLESNPVTFVERFDLALPEGPPPGSPWSLSFGSFSVGSTAVVRFFALTDLEHAVAERTVFRFGDSIERTALELPPGLPPTFRIEIRGQNGFLQPTFSFVSMLPGPSDAIERTLPLRVVAGRVRGGSYEVELELPPFAHPSSLRVEPIGTDRRPVELVVTANGFGGELELGRATIDPSGPAARRDVAIARTGSNSVRVRFLGRDAASATQLRVAGLLRRPTIVFGLPGDSYYASSATLYFGGGRARPYERTETTAAFEQVVDSPPTSNVGSIEPNPEWAAPPAFAFAMRPGAEVDRRAFRAFAPVVVPASPEGLVRIVVPAKVAAESNSGGTDLRVVDAAGRQWPYLVDPAVRPPLPMRVRASRSRESPRESVYAIALPSRGIPIVGVRIESVEPLVDRTVRIETTNSDGRRTQMASGRLIRRPDATTPVDVTLVDTVRGSLFVVVEDGDEAPLDLRFSLLLPAHELVVAARPGDYRLYVGALAETPESSEPLYDLAQSGGLAAAVSTPDATVSALVANPDSDPPSAWSRDRWRDLVLWAVLILATVTLFGMTYRLVRSSTPAGPTPTAPEAAPEVEPTKGDDA